MHILADQVSEYFFVVKKYPPVFSVHVNKDTFLKRTWRQICLSFDSRELQCATALT